MARCLPPDDFSLTCIAFLFAFDLIIPACKPAFGFRGSSVGPTMYR